MSKRIVIIAGEESGDKHAADLAHKLLQDIPDLQLSGIGGQHMQEAGVSLVSDLARYGVTGITEVIKHALVIKKAFAAIKKHLAAQKPDLLILVDYPGFNLRLAKYAKEVLGLRIIYYISPQIWAWKAKRIHNIKATIDHMAVILPFEKVIYEQAGVPVSFVGHPLIKRIPDESDQHALRKQLDLPFDKKVIALLPGSRRNEIDRHMPILTETVKRLIATRTDLHFVIPIAASLNPESIKTWFKDCTNITFLHGQAIEAVASSDCVVVASGTASLECALLLKPMCIIYKASLFTYLAAMKLVKVRYLGLCNLLQNRMIVPELLQYDCNPAQLTTMVQALLDDSDMTKQMQAQLLQMKQSLSAEKADCSLVELVKNQLSSR